MHAHLDHRVGARLRLRHLELLDVLGSTLNVHHAAPRMNLSQPATSKLLQETEQIYGTALFERGPRGLRATRAGDTAIRWARSLLYQAGESVAEVHLVAAGAVGRVRVGALSVAIPTLIEPALQQARSQIPGLVITFTEGSNELLLPALARNQLDVVLSRLGSDTQNASYLSEPLYDEPIRLVVRPRHPLLRKRKLSMSDLADVQWVLPPELAPMRQQLGWVFGQCGMRIPVPRIETTSQMLLTIALNQTDMVAAMPLSVATLYQSWGQLTILKLILPIAMPPVGMLTHAHAVHAPAVESFIRMIREAGSQQPTAIARAKVNEIQLTSKRGAASAS